MSKPLAYARLLRLPNLFTAAADPLAGWFLVGGGIPEWNVAALTGAGICLYAGGIVFNDWFDYRLDCAERPERPLPRGDISRQSAGILGASLMIAGLGLAALAGPVAAGIALFVAAMTFFYNAFAKRFALLGALTVGVCRFGNFLLGMRCCPPRLWIAPAILGVYCAALTLIARNEATQPALRRAVKNLLLGIIVLDAFFVAATGNGAGALLVLSLLIPAVVLSRTIEMT